MKKILSAALSLVLLAAQPAQAGYIYNPNTQSLDFTPSVTDGTTTVGAVRSIVFPAGTVADSGGGVVTVATGISSTLTDGNILVGNSSNVATSVNPSGDVDISNTGAFTIQANSVALGTDTTGNYVFDVADGTGIDGTAAAEGATYTPSLDLTEITCGTGIACPAATSFNFDSTEIEATTWGAGANASNIWTFNLS